MLELKPGLLQLWNWQSAAARFYTQLGRLDLIHHSARSHPQYILGYTCRMTFNGAGRLVRESQVAAVVSAIVCSIQMGTTEK